MAAVTTRSLALPAILLGALLLLSGCSGKAQTVSGPAKRSEPLDAGSSISLSDESRTTESMDIASAYTAGPVPQAGSADAKENNKNGEYIKNNENNQRMKSDSGNKSANESKPVQSRVSIPRKEITEAGAGSDEPVEIKFSEMYSDSSSRGLKFSDKLTGLNGKKVTMTGYMAPPLKPSFSFFVLTREPMAICPFCSTDASWPEDIVLIYLPKSKNTTPTDSVLKVCGTLELGSYTDPATGFVSQVRIYSDKIEIVR